MRAAVLEGVEDVKVHDDVEIDKPGVGEVLVRVHSCGVCHSDLHFVDGSLPCATPAILGHEAGGIVEAVGSGVTGLAEGDKVILTLRRRAAAATTACAASTRSARSTRT